MKYIRKRDGKLEEFNRNRIASAMIKAFRACGMKDGETSKRLSEYVMEKLDARFGDDGVATVEEIQDIVEETLMNARYHEVARAYILYRAQQQDRRDFAYKMGSADLIDSYIDETSWLVKENANMTRSMQAMNYFISSNVTSNYWLYRIYPPEVRKAHQGGDMHIHDLGILAPYCVGWDLRYVLYNGFPGGVVGKLSSGPPKHFHVALAQAMNMLYTMQGEAAGAQAFASFDTLLAPGIRYDGLSQSEVYQYLQGFFHLMNVPTRVGGQVPFTNVTIDMTVPKFIEDERVTWGGKELRDTYGSFQDEVDMFNKALVAVMTAGDHLGRTFSFPIPTYNITENFNWDVPGFWEMTAKYGIPYFGNFMPQTGLDPEDVRSMCCHLRTSNKQIRRGGGIFNAFPLTGSIGVVTINLARIGYLARDEDDFRDRLEDQLHIAKTSLIIKKKAIEKYTELDLYPYSKNILRPIMRRYGGYWSNHFLTVGNIGMNEACLNLFGENILSDEGKKLSIKTLTFINDKLAEYQDEEHDKKGYPVNMFNSEATPAEGTCYRLALLDKKHYPGSVVANEHLLSKGAEPFYTNSTQVPVDTPLLDAIFHQDDLQPLYTGGTVLHLYSEDKNPPPNAVRDLVQRVALKTHLPYFTFTPTFSICPSHGYLSGRIPECSICGKETEIYSRVVGYYRPLSHWNPGKKSEFSLRSTLNVGVN